MYLPENLLGGVKVPFRTEADLEALVGTKILYVCKEDIKVMGGRPHVFPRGGQVLTRDNRALLIDNGIWLEASEIMMLRLI
ncbi:hypothetical protein GF108_00085 [Phyllobacterium sp. SYP-B3895]|uniref:hypothetical protein n=1 Tax=Phyllobacterium sp. SYP-B3895 TaxID=2663240 RepID=UPI001299E691|nr:hypothetical protein [Phyllobacterium sp. SYP-B3895]MRG53983.1 hypothetical protein [Phyllobacterium sp. SYP-B3895]